MRITSTAALIFSIVHIGLLQYSAFSYAANMSTPTREEARSMPSYCHIKLFEEGTPAVGVWYQNYPNCFTHIHHLCYGLAYLNRSYSAIPKSDKDYLIKSVVGQLDYVITHSDASCKLLSDVHYYRGEVHGKLNKTAIAIQDLNNSLKIDPKQARTYTLLARLLDKASQHGKALEIVTEGLRHVPDSQSLQRQYVKLGGKLPYPEALSVKKPTTSTPTPPPSSSVRNSSDASISQVKSNLKPEIATRNEIEQELRTPINNTTTNPWCRFCPEVPVDLTGPVPSTPGAIPKDVK